MTYSHVNLAPLPKKPAGSAVKSGASSLSKSSLGKSSGFGSSGSKSTYGSASSKSNNIGSSASKTSNFGSSKSSNLSFTPNKLGNYSSTPSKSSAIVSTASKSSAFGSLTPKDASSTKGPSFLVAGGKFPSGHTPTTSKKTYETASYNPKSTKSTSFGIIWLPGRKRNKKKDVIYSAMNYDKKTERTPTMYNIMSGDSPDYQLHKKKDEETNLLVPEKVRGPIATAASAGAVAIVSEAPSDLPTELEDKLLSHEKEESKDAAGDGNITEKDDSDYNDVDIKSPETKLKSCDKIDGVFISPSSIKSPPTQSATSSPDEDECIVKCLYYTLQCCDCVIM